MKKTLVLLPMLFLLLMAFTTEQSPNTPIVPIQETSLIGKWLLNKVEAYGTDNSLVKTILAPKDASDPDTIIELLPNGRITLIKNRLINREGIAILDKWVLRKKTLVILNTSIEIPLKINQLTSNTTILELVNPKGKESQEKTLLYFTKVK